MLPEIIVIACAVVILLLDMFFDEKKRVLLGTFAAIGLTAAFAALDFPDAKRQAAILGGRFAMDAVAWWFKLLLIISGLVTVLISMDFLDGRVGVKVRGIGFRGEYYSILLFTISGMMFISLRP